MLQKLRQILLTQYIGAIVTAILAAQCVQTFANLILLFVWHLISVWRTPASILGESRNLDFDWATAIYTIVKALLYAAVVSGLMWWLYLGRQVSPQLMEAELGPPGPEAPSVNPL